MIAPARFPITPARTGRPWSSDVAEERCGADLSIAAIADLAIERSFRDADRRQCNIDNVELFAERLDDAVPSTVRVSP